MNDFHDFRNLVRASFPDLNTKVMMYELESALGGDLIRFRVQATGPKLREKLTVETTSATSAVEQLKSAVAFHCRGNATDEVLARLVKINPELTDEDLDKARAELTACFLSDFDKVTVKWLKAAEATQRQAA